MWYVTRPKKQNVTITMNIPVEPMVFSQNGVFKEAHVESLDGVRQLDSITVNGVVRKLPVEISAGDVLGGFTSGIIEMTDKTH